MALCRFSDPIRKKRVAATPEEKVRQELICQMIGPLKYPKGLIAVEKELGFPRRVDLLIFRKEKEGLFPLLIVECKAEGSEEKALEQLLGYNQWVKAPFMAIAFPGRIMTLWKEGSKLQQIPFLPSYQELLRSV